MKRETKMSKTLLLRIYKTVKRNPKRIFILKDFGGKLNKVYFDTLVKLNLIEKCQVLYKMGPKYSAAKGTNGYRLRRENETN